MADMEVAGRVFRTKADYMAALRDQEKIDAIRLQLDPEQPGEVISLDEEISAGKITFESLIGRDFADEIAEAAEQFRSKGYTKTSIYKLSKKEQKRRAENRAASVHTTDSAKKDARTSLSETNPGMQRQVRGILKRRELRRRIIVIVCAAIALGCFAYYGIYYYFADKSTMDYEELSSLKGSSTLSGSTHSSLTIHYTTEDEEEVELSVLDEYATLYEKNKSLIGWLKIDDTNIDYPVMQTVNNEYYLDHNFNQEYDKNGSLFLDADCDVVHRSTNLIIYGHHMKSGKMFGSLNKYSSESYYEKHPYIQFDTIYEKGTYEIMYVFRSRIYNEDEVVFKYYQMIDISSAQEFDSDMRQMAEMSLYDTGVTASYGDELLTLSTCDYTESDGRFVVVAKKIN